MKTIKSQLILFTIYVIGLLTVSCISEKPSELNNNCGYFLKISTLDEVPAQGNDILVYIYDTNGKLIGFQQTTTETLIDIDSYRSYGAIKVVVWGNTVSGPGVAELIKPELGSSILDNKYIQKASGQSFSGYALMQPPSDVFHGIYDISFTQNGLGTYAKPNSTTTVYTKRVASSYILTISSIKQAFDSQENDYKVIIRHPSGGLDHNGNPITIDGESYYLPDMSYDPQTDALTSGIEIALPTDQGKGLIIEIYSEGQLVYTATLDQLGNIMSLAPNLLHNILIDLSASIEVILVVSQWGDVVIFEEFSYN